MMAPVTRAVRTTYTWLAFGCVLVLLVVGGLLAVTNGGKTTLTAYFDRAVGLYPDSSVRVLGIEVGKITEVVPEGSAVRVEMYVDDGVPVPADAGAVVVAPSLVSDRYVQLTPAYEEGEQMAGGAVIPVERTAVPVELDDLFANLDELATTLGPDGVNADGALTGALDTLAENMDGTGGDMNSTITRLAELARTLEQSKGDAFATVSNLAEFTTMLAESDAQVGELFDRVADVTSFLAEESGEVDAALSSLAQALTDVREFVDENHELVSDNVEKLVATTRILVDRRGQLAEVLDVGPAGMNNFINAYDAASGTVGIRGNLNELTHPPVLMLCRLLTAASPEEVPSAVADTCHELAPVLDGTLPLPSVSEIMAAMGRGEPPPLPLPLVEAMEQASGGGAG